MKALALCSLASVAATLWLSQDSHVRTKAKEFCLEN